MCVPFTLIKLLPRRVAKQEIRSLGPIVIAMLSAHLFMGPDKDAKLVLSLMYPKFLGLILLI